jgi:hypothetical protein
MAGVKDVFADPIENAMHLKVDAKTFEIAVAQAIIKAQI